MRKRIQNAWAVAILVAGCGTYRLVEPRRTAIGDLYTVEPQVRWSAFRRGVIELWTVDGPSLQALRFVKGLKDGESLFYSRSSNEENSAKRPEFSLKMTASEIADFVADSMSALGAEKTEIKGLRPATFGSAQGFRFELTFLSRKGLEERAMAAGAVIKGKLYLLLYSGIEVYYYPKHIRDVEKMIQSIQFQ